jgi:hypothetical protein
MGQSWAVLCRARAQDGFGVLVGKLRDQTAGGEAEGYVAWVEYHTTSTGQDRNQEAEGYGLMGMWAAWRWLAFSGIRITVIE